MSKSTIGKSLKGYRTDQATSATDLKGLLASLSVQGLSLNNVTITTATIYGGSMDDVEIGSIQPSNGTFTNVYVGDGTGIGGVLVAYGNTVGDYVKWDPITGKLNVAGGISVRDPTTLGNIVISENNITAVNKDGSINLIPNSTNAAVNVAGSLVQTAPGNVNFDKAKDFSIVSAQGANITGASSASLVSTNGTTMISSVNSSVDISGAGPIVATSGTDILFDAGKGVSVTARDGPLDLLSNTTVQFRVDVPLTFLNDVLPPPVRGYQVPQIIATSTDDLKLIASDLILDAAQGRISLNSSNPVELLQGSGFVFGIDATYPVGTASIRQDVISNDLAISALRDLILEAGRNVVLPAEVPLVFSDSDVLAPSQRIYKTSEGFVIESTPPTPIVFKGDIQLPAGYKFSIGENVITTSVTGGLSVTSPQDLSLQSAKDVSINSAEGDITLASAGVVKIPDDVMLQIGDTVGVGLIANQGHLNVQSVADLLLDPKSGKIIANAVSFALPDRSEISFGDTAAISTLGDLGDLTLQSDSASILIKAPLGGASLTAMDAVTVASNNNISLVATQQVDIKSTDDDVSISAQNGAVNVSAQTVDTSGQQTVTIRSETGSISMNGEKNVNISSLSGKIDVEGKTGVDVSAVNGDISLIAEQNSIWLEAAAGLNARAVDGDAHIEALQGSVQVVGKDEIKLSAQTGDVSIVSAEGKVDILSNKDVSLSSTHGNATFSAQNDINLRAEKDVNVSAVDELSLISTNSSVNLTAETSLTLASTQNASLQSTSGALALLSKEDMLLSSTSASVNISALQGEAAVKGQRVSLTSTAVGEGLQLRAEQSNVMISANTGTVTTTGENVMLAATNGNISSTSQGSFDVNAQSSISLTSSAGDTKLVSVTGNVDLIANAGDVNVAASTGDIDVQTDEGNVAISSGSGNAAVAGRDVSLNASEKVSVPLDVPLTFGGNSRIYESAVDGKLHISDPEGVVIDKNVTVNGNFTVVGYSQHIFATVTTFHDGLLSLAMDAPATDKSDRGFEFLYHDATGFAKQGMMGFSQHDYRFHLVLDGTNVNETYDVNAHGDLELASIFASGAVTVPRVATQWITSGGPGQNLVLDAKTISLQPTEKLTLPESIPFQVGSSSLTDVHNVGLVVDTKSVQVAQGSLQLGSTTLKSDAATGNFSVNPVPATSSIALNGPVTIPQILNFGTGSTPSASVTLEDGKNLLVTSTGKYSVKSAETLQLTSSTNVAVTSVADTTLASTSGSVAITGQKTISLTALDEVAVVTPGYFTTNATTTKIESSDAFALTSEGTVALSSVAAMRMSSDNTMSLTSKDLLSLVSQVKIALSSTDVSLTSSRDVAVTAGNAATVTSSGLLSMSSDSEVSIGSQGTIGMKSNATLSLASLQNVAIESEADMDVTSKGNANLVAKAALALTAQATVSISAQQAATLTSSENVAIIADKILNLQSSLSTNLASSGNIIANSGAELSLRGSTSVGIASPGTVDLTAEDIVSITGTNDVKLNSSATISATSRELSVTTSDSTLVQVGGNLQATASKDVQITSQRNATFSSGQEMYITSQSTVAVQGAHGASLTAEKEDVTLRADQGRILLQSDAYVMPGKTLNFAQVSMTSQGDNVLTFSNNSDPSAPVDLSIQGKISGDCDWNGNPIAMSYGGTGHTDPWLPRSIVFVNAAGNLTDKPLELCWDTSIQSMGIRTTATSAEAAVSIGSGHVDLLGERAKLRSYTAGNLSWEIGATLTVSSRSVYELKRSSTSSSSSASSSTSFPVIAANEQGQVGFGILADTMGSLPINAGLVHVPGDISFVLADTTASLRWDQETFIRGHVLNGVLEMSGRTRTVVNTRLTCANGVQWGESGTLTMTAEVSEESLTIKAPSRIYLTSPHVIHSDKICYAHGPNDECTTYLQTQARLDGNGRDLTFVNSDGDIHLAPRASVDLVGEAALSFPGAGSLSKGPGGTLAISSTTETVFSPGTSGLVSVINNGRISMQGTTAGTSANLGIDADGNFSVQTSSNVAIELATDKSVSLPDNIPLVFGSNALRKIASDGDSLLIQSPDLITLSSNNVVVTGNFVVKKTSTFTVESETGFDSGIINLGGGQLVSIVSLESGLVAGQTLVTVNGPHSLIPGDTVVVSDTIPNVDGTYSITSVPTVNSFLIDKTFPGIPVGAIVQGTVRTSLTQNPNTDVGVVVNWHTGAATGTADAQTGFFGFDRSTGRFIFIPKATRVGDTFSGVPGDLQIGDIYSSSITSTGTLTGQHLAVNDLVSPLFTGTQRVTGSNFVILGGSIDGTPIGSLQPSQGTFTFVDITEGLIVRNANLVANLNADLLDGKHAAEFVLRDGSVGLTADWNAGPHVITAGGLAALDLDEMAVPFVGNSGRLVTDVSSLAMKNGVLTLQKLSGFVSTGGIDLDSNAISNGAMSHVSVSNSTLSNSEITTSNITIPAGFTLDVSAGAVNFADRQISGNVIAGGIAHTDISGTADLVRDGVYGRDFAQDNTIIKADTAGNPVSLTVPEGTFVGRLPGTDTQISALTKDEAMTLLNAVSNDAFDKDNSLLKADARGNPIAVEVPSSTLVGRSADGPIRPLSTQEVRDLLNLEPITTAAIYREGALLRSGRSAEYPDGGTMTGLLLTSSERFHIATGQNIRSLDIDVETSYIMCDYLRTGGRVARCKLGTGYADGHRKLIILSSLAEYAFLQISCNLIAGGTPDPCGFIFYLAGQSAMLQWDGHLMKWLIIGGSGAQVVTPDDLLESDAFLDFLAKKRSQ